MKKTFHPSQRKRKPNEKDTPPSQWSNFFQEWNEKNGHRVIRGSFLTLAKRMERKNPTHSSVLTIVHGETNEKQKNFPSKAVQLR